MTPKELRLRRVALGWSREQLAANLGVTPGIVASWEDGRQRPSLDPKAELLLSAFERTGSAKLHIRKVR